MESILFFYLVPFCENRDYFCSKYFRKKLFTLFQWFLFLLISPSVYPICSNFLHKFQFIFATIFSSLFGFRFSFIFCDISTLNPFAEIFLCFPDQAQERKNLFYCTNFNHVIRHSRPSNNWAERCLYIFSFSNYQLDRINFIHSYQVSIIHFDNVITEITLKNLS